MDLTIFTTCKKFSGKADIHQKNALRSWRKVFPEAEIWIYAPKHDAEPIAKELQIKLVKPNAKFGASGTPFINKMFRRPDKTADFDQLCYINADIMVIPSLREAMEKVLEAQKQNHWKNFLMIGRRWDVKLDKKWDFNDPDWAEKLKKYAKEHGRKHPEAGIDYFFYLRGLFRKGELPPFLVARMGWDNYLPWYVLHVQRQPLINASKLAFVVHANHHRSRPAGEVAHNRNLHGGTRLAFCSSATWKVTKNGVKRR